MACWMRSRVGWEMGRAPVRTYDTVLADTPASRATSAMVGATPSSFVAMAPRFPRVDQPSAASNISVMLRAAVNDPGVRLRLFRGLSAVAAPGLNPAQNVLQHPPGRRPAGRFHRLQ